MPRCQNSLNRFGASAIEARAGDRPMAKPALNRPRVVPLVGQSVAAGVPQACRSIWGWALSSGQHRLLFARSSGQSRPW